MIIYNVTCKVETTIVEEWKKWMLEEHIPEVIATKKFSGYTFSRVVSQDTDGETFSTQYYAADMAAIHKYTITEAPALKQKVIEKYGEKVLAFRTLMEVINQE